MLLTQEILLSGRYVERAIMFKPFGTGMPMGAAEDWNLNEIIHKAGH